MYKFLPLLFALFAISQETNAQCEPQLLNCNAPVLGCDLTPNSAQYWNAIEWWDPIVGIHDLAEAEIDLNLMIRDTCPGDSLSVRCLLFLDLDGDGIKETVVDSDNPPAAGTVNFNNYNTPNYSGGTPRVFDQRPVSDNLKWKFALNTTTTGDTSTFRLHWVSDAAPSVLGLPALAYGTHQIRWEVTNSAGDLITCEKVFTIKDCQKPTVVCLNGLSVNIMPTQMIQLWSTDFLQYAEDNVTLQPQLKLGVRKTGTGTGFPVDANGNPVTGVLFNCDELGTQSVELWAIDLAGNADYCETYVIVQDNLGNCNGDPVITACVSDACGIGSEETTFDFSVLNPLFPPLSYFDMGECGSFFQSVPVNSEVVITPVNDNNYLNGVTTYDLILIKKHIDGIDLFDTPFQWIAADANNDHVVDTTDIEECKKLILGIYTELPNNLSWRFVDKNYVFPSPNPLSAPFPESITIDMNNLPTVNPEFVGIKICDVTCGNLVGFYDLEPENEHLVGNPEPNPTNEGAMLPLQLIGSETVKLELFDFSGKLIFHNQNRLPEGPAMLEIPALAMAQPGVYVWRVQAGEVSKSGKLLRF